MSEGDVILASVPQADGLAKVRPAVFLRAFPVFGDLLVVGLSSQLHQEVRGFDELLAPTDPDYTTSGVRVPSLIRLNFLGIVAAHAAHGGIGKISRERHQRILQRLANFLRPS